MDIIEERSCLRTAISLREYSVSEVRLLFVISARRTIRSSTLYFLLNIMSSRLSSSWAWTSVRNPNLPRFMPRIGICWLPMRLAVASKVPSPPRLMAISPEKLLSNTSNSDMSSIPEFCISLANSLSNRMFAPRCFSLKNSSLTELMNFSLYLLPNTNICIN